MNNLKKLTLCICTLSLVGCMDTAMRLWNSGPYMSDKERNAYHRCYDERRANLPEIYNKREVLKQRLTVEEIDQYNDYLSQCLRRQGF